jgi:hypothetical protein
VLKLNAMDEEALASLNDIEQAAFGSPVEEAKMSESPLSEERPAESMLGAEPLFEETQEKAVSPDSELPDFLSEEMPAEADRQEDELSDFKDSLFGGKAGADEEVHAGIGLKADEPVEIREEPFDESDEEEISFGDINESVHSSGTAPGVESAGFTTEMFSKGAGIEEEKSGMDPVLTPAETFGLEDANAMVSEGNYTGAMSIYRRILSADPFDKKVLQRVEELKSLLKFLGKDKEALIERLNAFMKGIKKRQDEFHRSS